jgi:hypothetical protein
MPKPLTIHDTSLAHSMLCNVWNWKGIVKYSQNLSLTLDFMRNFMPINLRALHTDSNECGLAMKKYLDNIKAI